MYVFLMISVLYINLTEIFFFVYIYIGIYNTTVVFLMQSFQCDPYTSPSCSHSPLIDIVPVLYVFKFVLIKVRKKTLLLVLIVIFEYSNNWNICVMSIYLLCAQIVLIGTNIPSLILVLTSTQIYASVQ